MSLTTPYSRRLIAGLLLALGWVTGPARAQLAFGAPDGSAPAHHTQVTLRLSAATARPGDTILAGVDMQMEPGWHTYWKNPGDAGTATTIEWTLPPGMSAGAIQWPLPEKLPPAEVTTYGYDKEAVLIVPLTLSTNLAPGEVQLSAKVAWLECKDSCLPADTVVSARLSIGPEARAAADAAFLQTWQRQTPQTSIPALVQAWWELTASNDTRFLVLAGTPTAAATWPPGEVDFYPDASEQFEVQAATEKLPQSVGFGLRKTVKKLSGDWPRQLSGVLVVEGEHPRHGFEIQATIGDTAPSSGGATGGLPPSSELSPSLWRMLLLAFLGGLILNLMPCVLPVIALKILGFVSEAHSEPRRVRHLGVTYTLGVLFSFLGLAGIVIGFKAAGHQAGWGMQFGSPVFIVALTTLVLLVALNLFGVFEVVLGGRAMDTASGLASKSGAPGAFFNGMLATTLATPCTAPFLAPALGFAFQQSAGIIVLIFLTVGMGLSAPYLILSWQPAWLKFLPRPGGWMEKFKVAMGFPMLATLVWLFNLAAGNYGRNVVWLGIFLVLVALAAWVFGEFVQRGRKHRGAAAAIVFLLLAGSYGFILEQQLHWRSVAEPAGTVGAATSADGLDWLPWSPAAVAAARAEGRPVLVDFTADWCLTCQLNKKTSLEAPAVRARLKELHAATLIGDYTRLPEAITRELNRFGRAGVPLVLVYPKDPQQGPAVLPALLTPTLVTEALAGRAAAK